MKTKATHTPTLTIVAESATHIAFLNGPTFTKEQILNQSEVIKQLLKALHEARYLLMTKGITNDLIDEAFAKANA